MDMISKDLHSELGTAGFKIKTFKAQHINEISIGFEKFVAQGLMDEDFYKSNLTSFNYDNKSLLKNGKSVIVIAAQQCKSLAEFEYGGRIIELIIPPTYLYPSINSRIENILNDILVKNGYGLVKAILPLKLLAVRSGLGLYGRNNICYIPGLGSFIRLAAFMTDYEFEEDNWGEIRAMKSCSTCSACVDQCPTGAIRKEHFLIQAQNCLTNFNEDKAPIPEWINPDWHDSIVGCMKCQAACPQNTKLIELVDERICFSKKETELILNESTFNDLPAGTRNKISYAGMEPYYNVLPRNIRLLINNK